MKKSSCLFLVIGMVVMSTAAYASYDVYSSGPLYSTSIDFYIADSGPSSISQITYALQNNFVIDPPVFSVVNPSGITYSEFENASNNQFGFNFSGFDVGENFRFSWDPDKVGDPVYGAIIQELVGTQVTLVTGEGTLYGTMVIDADHLVTLWGVPEPVTLLLLGFGLAGLAGLRRRL